MLCVCARMCVYMWGRVCVEYMYVCLVGGHNSLFIADSLCDSATQVGGVAEVGGVG